MSAEGEVGKRICIELCEFEFEARAGIKIWGSGGAGRVIDLSDLSGSRPLGSIRQVS